jgi:tight adherence protein C
VQTLSIGFGMFMVLSGTAAVVVAAWRSRATTGHLAYLRETGDLAGGVHQDPRLAQPLARRVLRPLGRGVLVRLGRLCPPANLDRLHEQLLHAGLAASLRAEELATLQALVAGAAVAGAVAVVVFGRPPARLALLALVFVPFVGVTLPRAWLNRRIRSRAEAVQNDLPDVLDLMTISVEAGLGLEQAIEAVCGQIDSPLCLELAATLREMSLGLSRRDAFENLRRRVAVEDLSSMIVVLMQADALGMPIGRALRAQADEMRDRRRQRAREKAAKLPVKILFPLVAFVFPPTMIIVIGPAAHTIMRALEL